MQVRLCSAAQNFMRLENRSPLSQLPASRLYLQCWMGQAGCAQQLTAQASLEAAPSPTLPMYTACIPLSDPLPTEGKSGSVLQSDEQQHEAVQACSCIALMQVVHDVDTLHQQALTCSSICAMAFCLMAGA